MAVPENPCYKCERRCVGCHSNCAEYSLYRAELTEYNAAIHKAKNEERAVREYEIRQALKRRH